MSRTQTICTCPQCVAAEQIERIVRESAGLQGPELDVVIDTVAELSRELGGRVE